jgi:amino acid adenylation domain-containing protein
MNDDSIASDVVTAFLRVAQANPDLPAIIDNGRELYYADVWQRARELAARLGPGCGVVGVMVARSANTVIALLGVLAAGGTYCPIDPSFPCERQKTIARLSSCTTVVGDGVDRATFPGLRIIDVGEPHDDQPANLAGDRDWLASAAAAEAPAYILFTSGSTGEPKAVVTSRGAIAAAVQSLRELLELQPSDRVLQFASLNWDTCFEEILTAVTVGAALVIDDDAYSGSISRLLRLIHREGITAIDIPTAFWHELVYYMSEAKAVLPECLRLVIIGGEAARPARLADWCALDTSRTRLVNTYGCTETTLVTHAIDLHGPRAESPATRWVEANEVPIGHRMPHVVERISETGELLIGGPGLALGYLGAPHATDSRFRILDLGDGPARYFLTGDRVLRSPTGELLHRGRLDGQIKIRGIRVDPGEVEAELARCDQVAAVAVVGVTVADHTTLVAYVVPRPGATVGTLAMDLVADLRRRVPAHLIPSQLIVVTELIHTPSGKIDRAASHKRHAPGARGRRTVNES